MSRILTAAQAAEILRIPEDDVLGMVAEGELPALAVNGDEVMVAESALREFLNGAWVGEAWEGLR